MNWDKINIKSILKVLREFEKETPSLNSSPSIIYSDGKEELKISYKRIRN